MHRSVVGSGGAWPSDHVTATSCFNGKLNSAESSSAGRFHLQVDRRAAEVDRSRTTVHTSGSSSSSSSSSRNCDRNYSPQISSSTVDIGPCDIYRKTSSTGISGRGGCSGRGSSGSDWSDYDLLEPCSSRMDTSRIRDTDADVSSSTPDGTANAEYFVRHRSVSFCSDLPSAKKTNCFSPSESKPGVSNYSILESILLNRNVPPFYSSVESGDNRRDGGSTGDDRVAGDGNYKRPRLRSLPLPSIIPPSGVHKGHSNQRSCLPYWLPSKADKPLCLAFRRRKVSVDGEGASESVVSSLRGAEQRDGFRESDSQKGVRRASILHSLLTYDSTYDDRIGDGRPERMDVTQSSPPEPEDENRNLNGCHVDSTESLPTLERLALGERPRPLGVRQQRVVIAKKMQLVVNRKVRRWLVEIAQLAAKYRALTDLPREDWVLLLRHAVSKLLLLYMAEGNFQFAVAPVATEASTGDGVPLAPAEVPTAGSVEDIQRFIAKCQMLKVDSKEYQCMRLITLFHSGCTNGLKRIGLVEQINSGACKILQDLVRLSHPGDKLRYGELLLHLRSLASLNGRMVQRLFCVMSDGRGISQSQMDDSQWLTFDDP